ncbi:RNA polymerase sigma-70 factor, ECF subfamily [Chitinophaga jiangningensis]|uniref:RNA polymerase sigma-70 factor, ECF subfamily n=1 Tax=Chitinophaga jiangningensis TaxID=1419482 RepID=A0A1M7J168_9BACT|nr:sigma-70 family RNA polymerase sigma factor [Chitinophaga jiangningensis]SHM46658.1 RNA polymerase sigma-70 factor, ECF subfamily [Chitinophaga jiangningensis]
MKQTSPATIPDAVIIEKIENGEKQRFELLIRKYNQRLYRLGMSILADPADTEDAMQTAYIHAYEGLAQLETPSFFGTWLTRIMLNQCLAQKRKGNYHLPITNNNINMTTPANELLNKELSQILENAIAQLPEKYRLVFVLREIEAMSVRETSDTLSIQEVNVKVRLNRAKAMLRQNLHGYMKDSVYSFHLSKCDRIVHYVMHHLGIADA